MEKERRETFALGIEVAQEKDIAGVASIAAKLKLDVANSDPHITGKGFPIEE